MVLSIFIFILNFFSCNNSPQSGLPALNYDLSAPDQVLMLPDTLREISGITRLSRSEIACVQDENGIVFIYDVKRNAIAKQFSFNGDGDYEGIARAGKMLYVLRSDGMLFEVSNYASGKSAVQSYETGIPIDDNEGLCYDKANDRLLIGCKAKPGKSAELKNKRMIYAFDLKTKKLSENPVFEFDITKIRQFAEDNLIALPLKAKKEGKAPKPHIKFSISAIAIHPVTGKLFVISSTDPILFVFDMQGNVEHITLLDKKLFNKAEGMTFFKNGDMLISNEGQSNQATLLRFNYKK